MILWLSKILLPFVISYVIAFGLISRRPIFNDFLDGAKNGMKTVADILPTLIGLIAADHQPVHKTADFRRCIC